MIVISLISALLLTIFIELIVAYLIRFRGRDEYRVLIYMNIVTNLSLNILINIIIRFFHFEYFTFVLIGEVVVLCVEYYILQYVFGRSYSKKRLMITTFTINFVSFIIGLLMYNIMN